GGLRHGAGGGELRDGVGEAAGRDGNPHPAGAERALVFGVVAHIDVYEANCAPILRPRFPAGGPSSPASRADTRCSRPSVGTAAAPARRSRGRTPRGLRTWPGCSSSPASW